MSSTLESYFYVFYIASIIPNEEEK